MHSQPHHNLLHQNQLVHPAGFLLQLTGNKKMCTGFPHLIGSTLRMSFLPPICKRKWFYIFLSFRAQDYSSFLFTLTHLVYFNSTKMGLSQNIVTWDYKIAPKVD
ncbi:hypothetical protein MLD38_014802 [Melastoma candidum]|uniref:Uncharacterized protein n=1 Tax=Melastoma candidum TaxID=119954 RepID=A0ACB9RI55_9MYRT|nr:hypothetical protein MLD38_014802 [Melastoma candidum]